jgi:cyclohexanone monooxygenase
VLANMVLGIEQHVDWIAGCLTHLREADLQTVEPTDEASAQWVEHVRTLIQGSVRTADSCTSWYLGANVPGKKRVYMPYAGGLPAYRQKCDEVATAGYDGFVLS